MSESVLATTKRDDDQPEAALRPQTLAEFIGQAKVRSNLKIFIDAARARREPLDAILRENGIRSESEISPVRRWSSH